jgi:hypothetical protein
LRHTDHAATECASPDRACSDAADRGAISDVPKKLIYAEPKAPEIPTLR